MSELIPAPGGEAVDDPDTVAALERLVAAWVEESNGRCSAVCSSGDIGQAMWLLGVRRAQVAPLRLETALGWMAWAAGSGGAHGRRRGAAAGRLAAWWVLSELTELGWPPPPDLLGEAASELEWYAWSDLGEASGWSLHLAVTSPAEKLTWVIAASDAA